MDAKYSPSADVVAREIAGELIIVPITSGIGNMGDELFSLNETGKAIWDRLDGNRSVGEIVTELTDLFESPANEIEEDVMGFLRELLRRGMLAES